MFPTEMIGPSTKAYSVTPSDSTDLTQPCRKLTCLVAGAVSIITAGGDTISISLVAGVVWDACYFTRVRSTGTAATGIVAYY